jgi:hypothetical protein
MPQNNLPIPLLYLHTFFALALDEVAGQFRTLVLPYKALLQTPIPSRRGGVDINIWPYLESKPDLTAA